MDRPSRESPYVVSISALVIMRIVEFCVRPAVTIQSSTSLPAQIFRDPEIILGEKSCILVHGYVYPRRSSHLVRVGQDGQSGGWLQGETILAKDGSGTRRLEHGGWLPCIFRFPCMSDESKLRSEILTAWTRQFIPCSQQEVGYIFEHRGIEPKESLPQGQGLMTFDQGKD